MLIGTYIRVTKHVLDVPYFAFAHVAPEGDAFPEDHGRWVFVCQDGEGGEG